MEHYVLIALHLMCATIFIGIVAFEVLILEGIRAYLPAQYMQRVELGIHTRAKKVMPWVVALLYITGFTMATHHFKQLNWAPFESSFGTILSIKIFFVLSVLTHFILAMKHSICGTMSSDRFRYTHLSVFIHMIIIVLLAKGMYYISW